ncbi:MAG: hypothetical protein SOY64_09280 [Pyramidobacter sp.]|uniref:hypothetical protein n=1 Tax=Pyramidobacter sp. TaxID=1943581 RepID=UPI002A801E62|nr:hypothetical protein [Pyramidobacter sp.]MDY4033228.1 hypothetical protein [Pyramidobacter sp.]
MESALLLFSPELPCWDAETASLAGSDPGDLEGLSAARLLAPSGGGLVLTAAGAAARERVSRELCVPAVPMRAFARGEVAAREALELNRMAQLLDRSFMTDWGVKEITVSERFPVVPCLSDDRYFALENGRARALWPDEPLVKSFKKAFPNCGYESRHMPAPGPQALERWAARNGAPQGTLTVDFVLRHRHDFNHYRRYEPLPTDVFRFVDAGLIMARKVAGRPEELLPFLGKVHVFFMEQRRAYIPGWFDMDHDEQEPWKLLTLVTDGEAQLEWLTSVLRGWGKALIEPAAPMFILGTSIERMRAQREPARMFYDWFQEHTVRILRPDVDDQEDLFG